MTADQLASIGHDPQAFESFYRANVEDVMRFIARRVSDPHLAADLTADVFLAAIEAAPRYRSARGTPRAWLFGIARNVVSGERRRAAREQRAFARIDGRRLLAEDDVERLQERIDAAREARTLYGALLDLPEGERAVLELVALDDLTVTEAAGALGLRGATARVRLHRARVALRQAGALGHPGDPTDTASLFTSLETS
jgi:RNA polymerase sigma factor (sigma-70 family)